MKPRNITLNDHRYKWWIRKSRHRYSSRYKVVIQSPFGYQHVFPINDITSDNMSWDIDEEFAGTVKPSDIRRTIEEKKLK